ncbi:MAG: sigma-70 family RNA polymerase sigma factor [Chloroflexota bacterium]|jgi:RNA polymerase sigma-70 factor (ECF subfamily)|nr:sigma-70 family RNA polymerase sigma factor [Chloroflexota bacterium]
MSGGNRSVTDALIVRQAQQGDAAAYEKLVRRYQTVAFRTAWLVLGDAEDAHDATQTAFLKAWLHIGRVDAERSFQPWLLTIVANEARNRRRARGRWLARMLPEDRIELLAEPGPTPEQQVEHKDEARAVLRHLAAMEETDRMTLWCRYVLGLREEETADVMGCPVGTVKSRTHRAMERLRTRLRQAGMLEAPVEGGQGDG